MEQTLDDFEPVRNYRIVIRQFAGGTLEAVTRVIRPMQQEAAKRRFEESGHLFRRPRMEGEELSDFEKQINHGRAVRRAKQGIRFLCKQMQADRLLTLTYRENLEDRERVKEDFKRFLRLLRAEVGDWKYVAVLERQDRGAYHIHCAVKGWQKISALRKAWYRALGGTGFERGGDTPGQVDVTSPKQRDARSGRQWRTDRLAGYITKYLEKTFDLTAAEKRRYWSSKGIDKPVVDRAWLCGAELPEQAVASAVSYLKTFYGLGDSWDMWLSPDQTTFWLSAKIPIEGGASCLVA
jgi:hypothetical protein